MRGTADHRRITGDQPVTNWFVFGARFELQFCIAESILEHILHFQETNSVYMQ